MQPSTSTARRLARASRRFAGVLLGAALTSCSDGPPAETAFMLVHRLDAAELDLDEPSFLSRRPDGRLSGPVTLGRETQQALWPPLPSRIGFDVDLPPDAILRFAIAVSTLGVEVSPAAVEFKVWLEEEDGASKNVFEGEVRRREPNRFLDQEVDLSPWSGSRVRLVFETVAKSEDGGASLPVMAYWANPVLSSQTHREGPPDVILVSLDCVRADHLGPYGYERDTSPRIDELSKDAVVFEQAVSVSSYTHPTHMTMLTGLPPSIHGVSRWRKPDASVDYLPQILANAGYRTSGVVSGPLLSQSFGFERGFHTYHAFDDRTRAPELVDRALEMLRRGRGQPQFLFLHFFDAHWPYWPPGELDTRFGPRPDDASELLRKVRHQIPPDDASDVQHAIDLYDGEIVFLDREVGRFLDALETMDLYEESLVIVTADHGEAFMEHGYWEHGQTLYEEMVHVPLIVKWPEGETGRVEELVGQVDLFPTILEAAGLEPRGEGVALRRYIDGTAPPERELVLELTWDPLKDREARMLVAWRSETYKYLASFAAPSVDELYRAPIVGEELFDLVADPEEKTSILASNETVARGMRRSVLDYLARARELRSVRKGQDVELDEELRRRLETLGYIER